MIHLPRCTAQQIGLGCTQQCTHLFPPERRVKSLASASPGHYYTQPPSAPPARSSDPSRLYNESSGLQPVPSGPKDPSSFSLRESAISNT
ncbi:unnamed protein product [Arctogadus glacialis]